MTASTLLTLIFVGAIVASLFTRRSPPPARPRPPVARRRPRPKPRNKPAPARPQQPPTGPPG